MKQNRVVIEICLALLVILMVGSSFLMEEHPTGFDTEYLLLLIVAIVAARLYEFITKGKRGVKHQNSSSDGQINHFSQIDQDIEILISQGIRRIVVGVPRGFFTSKSEWREVREQYLRALTNRHADQNSTRYTVDTSLRKFFGMYQSDGPFEGPTLVAIEKNDGSYAFYTTSHTDLMHRAPNTFIEQMVRRGLLVQDYRPKTSAMRLIVIAALFLGVLMFSCFLIFDEDFWFRVVG